MDSKSMLTRYRELLPNIPDDLLYLILEYETDAVRRVMSMILNHPYAVYYDIFKQKCTRDGLIGKIIVYQSQHTLAANRGGRPVTRDIVADELTPLFAKLITASDYELSMICVTVACHLAGDNNWMLGLILREYVKGYILSKLLKS